MQHWRKNLCCPWAENFSNHMMPDNFLRFFMLLLPALKKRVIVNKWSYLLSPTLQITISKYVNKEDFNQLIHQTDATKTQKKI